MYVHKLRKLEKTLLLSICYRIGTQKGNEVKHFVPFLHLCFPELVQIAVCIYLLDMFAAVNTENSLGLIIGTEIFEICSLVREKRDPFDKMICLHRMSDLADIYINLAVFQLI